MKKDLFSGDVPDEILKAHIESFTQKTGRSDYPLYYPKTRRFCVFTIYK
ncbi:MAG: hypothetical protein HUJ65_03580 [Oscillospiraceae bacterium]|nr:hypothetical protein [Oscillospiraceae bacterium]